DIYAMGVILYEAITGRRPYGDEPHTATTVIMAHHLFAEPIPIRNFVPHCPEGVWVLVYRCLQKDPANRYQTADELGRDMSSVLDKSIAAAGWPAGVGLLGREPPALPFGDPTIVEAGGSEAPSEPPAQYNSEDAVTLNRSPAVPGALSGAVPGPAGDTAPLP